MGDFRIAIDFDSTIVLHDYPNIGPDVPGAIRWITAWQNAGAKIILFTMRGGQQLLDAVRYLESHDIELYGINTEPEQTMWTNSPKAHAEMYIDDRAFGCPLIKVEGDWVVDWDVVGPQVLQILNGERWWRGRFIGKEST
jgi:hypothetical protein